MQDMITKENLVCAPLLRVKDLRVAFRMYDSSEGFFSAQQKLVEVIHDLSITVDRGQIFAVVGASGSGKTLLADTIMGLFQANSEVSGSIEFKGSPMTLRDLERTRGRSIAFVPQSVSYLNPVMKVGRQVEGFLNDIPRKERVQKRKALFARYGLDEAVADKYPFELSGGMARRVLLCCAMMSAPDLIIADEPTPGLDIELAIRALDDFRSFANEGGGVLLITHDIDLALRVADRIAVFKDGTVIEETDVACFSSPEKLKHPFTRALWYAMPIHDFAVPSSKEEDHA